MVTIDLHTHTIASGHGSTATISDMAKEAGKRGIKILGISDHGPATPGSASVSYFKNLTLAPRVRFGVTLLYGVELNILDAQGSVDLPDEIIDKLNYAIISMHTKNITPGTMDQNTNAYIMAMRHPKVRIIGHCDDVNYPVDYHALLKAAKENHVIFELNNVSLLPESYRGNTYENNLRMLSLCMEHNYPVLLSSDSHGTKNLGNTKAAEILMSTIGFPKRLILNYNSRELTSFLNCKTD